MRVVITAMLQSPKFLYHVEAGGETPGSSYSVDSYALASRLSYFLWDTMPDATLFRAAADGVLGDQNERERQVDRMLAAPRAREAFGRLHRQWLRVDQLDLLTKDGASFPSFTPTLALAMKNEVSDFANHVIFEGDRRLETLFTASYTVTSDPELLAFYGSTTTAADGTHPLDPSQRAGLLTRAAPMAALASSLEASPIKRGVFVRKNVLCQALPPPPQAVTPPAVDRNASTRQRFAQHAANPACAGCHQLIDPVGFGFEHYDAIGAYQTTQAGLPIDATGELTSSDVDGTFDGAVELSTKLARSQEVSDCVASQWFRFALDRTPTDQDECSVQQLRAALSASGGDLRELIRAIVASDAFRLARRE